MSSFQFGFNFGEKLNDEEVNACNVQESRPTGEQQQQQSQQSQRERKPMHVLNIQETITTHLNSNMKNLSQWKHDVIQIGNKDSLKRIHPSEKPFTQQESPSSNNSSRRLDETSDLISGVYEGGLKVWECSIDLCNYLSQDLSHGLLDQVCSTDGGSVLELGCGHGLPACLALKHIMNHRTHSTTTLPKHDPLVVFTDYNDYVLSDVTLPNIILNTTFTSSHEDEILISKQQIDFLNTCTTLLSGDWLHLSDTMKSMQIPQSSMDGIANHYGKFDLIFAAETTYSLESSTDTAHLLLHHLKPNGVGLVACKRYYFGVGGGSDAFVKAAKGLTLDESGVEQKLQLELVRQYNDGKSNIRDLWKVTVVSSNTS